MTDYNTNDKPYFDDNFADLNCDWCLENGIGEVQAFASVPFGQSGWSSPQVVCRNCLCAVISNEIENLITCPSDQYDGKAWLVPFEKEVIFKIALEGLN